MYYYKNVMCTYDIVSISHVLIECICLIWHKKGALCHYHDYTCCEYLSGTNMILKIRATLIVNTICLELVRDKVIPNSVICQRSIKN